MLALALGCAASFAQAQTVVFNDTFGDGSTIASNPVAPATPSLKATAYQQIVGKALNGSPSATAGHLKFTMVSTGSAANQIQALFSQYPVTLTGVGDFIRLKIVFTNEAGVFNATVNNALMLGLYNAAGVQPIAGGQINSTVAIAGGAQTWTGYLGRVYVAGSVANSNAFLVRPAAGAATANNQDLIFQPPGSTSAGTTSNLTQPAALTVGAQYTMVLNIEKTGASALTLTHSLYSGTDTAGTPLFTQATTTASITTSVFDAFAVGYREASQASIFDVNNIQVTTNAPTTIVPAINTQPLSLTKAVGEPATFTVVADGGTGTALTYQWKKDNVDIPGATSASYAIASCQLADAGSYTVVVTDIAGSTTSNVATLAVSSGAVAPSIVTHPADATILVTGSNTFGVFANGTPPLTYQWQKSTNGGSSYSDVPLATADTLAIANAVLADAGMYRVVVTNAQGTATSNGATLTVNEAPSISGQPTGGSISAGGSITLSVTATGSPAPTYQWKKNGNNIAGATAASYAITGATGADAGNYTVTVTNTVGNVTSATASVVVASASMATTGVTPANSATGLNPDTRLTITFNEPVTPGISGLIRIIDASNDSVVETIDLVEAYGRRATLRAMSTIATLDLPVLTKPIGGIANNFNYYPITVSGNTATIYPRNNVLAYGKTYYVRVDAGAFLNASGEAFAGIVGSSRVDLQACKLEYSIVSPK